MGNFILVAPGSKFLNTALEQVSRKFEFGSRPPKISKRIVCTSSFLPSTHIMLYYCKRQTVALLNICFIKEGPRWRKYLYFINNRNPIFTIFFTNINLIFESYAQTLSVVPLLRLLDVPFLPRDFREFEKNFHLSVSGGGGSGGQQSDAPSDARPAVHAGGAKVGRNIPRTGRGRRTVPRETGLQDVRQSGQVQSAQQSGVSPAEQVNRLYTIAGETSRCRG